MHKKLIDELLDYPDDSDNADNSDDSDNNLNQFKLHFRRILNQTPTEHNTSKIEFWIYCFLGATATTKGINCNVAYYKENRNYILILASKKKYTTKIHYIMIEKRKKSTKPEDVVIPSEYCMELQKEVIDKNYIVIVVNIKKCTVESCSMSKDKSNEKNSKIPKIYTKKNHNTFVDKKDIYLTLVNNMKQLKPLSKEDVTRVNNKAKNSVTKFIDAVEDLFHTTKFEDQKSNESMHHGFTYGVLINRKYENHRIDVFNEITAGRGSLDLYFLLDKKHGIPVIIEFKADKKPLSVEDGLSQVGSRGYINQIITKTDSDYVVIVSSNFNDSTVKAKGEVRNTQEVKQDFISTLTKAVLSKGGNKNNTVHKQLLDGIGNIFLSTRKEESVDKIILGDLLSSQQVRSITILFKKGLTILTFILTLSNHKDYFTTLGIATSSKFNLGNKRLFNIPEYIKSSEYVQSSKYAESLRINNDEIDGLVVHMQINTSANTLQESKTAQDYFLKELSYSFFPVKSEDCSSDLERQPLKEFKILNVNATDVVNIKHLIHELQDTNSNSTGREIHKINNIFNIIKSKFIIKEADFKSVIHGLFLGKQFNNKMITIRAEVSMNRGKADLVLIFAATDISQGNEAIVIELAVNKNSTDHSIQQTIDTKIDQVEKYINHSKIISMARKVTGVALVFSPNVDHEKVITMKNKAGHPDTYTTDECQNTDESSQSSTKSYNSGQKNVLSPSSASSTNVEKKQKNYSMRPTNSEEGAENCKNAAGVWNRNIKRDDDEGNAGDSSRNTKTCLTPNRLFSVHTSNPKNNSKLKNSSSNKLKDNNEESEKENNLIPISEYTYDSHIPHLFLLGEEMALSDELCKFKLLCESQDGLLKMS